MVYSCCLRVQGLGFRVLGSEVQGSRFKVLDYFGFNVDDPVKSPEKLIFKFKS